MTNSVGVTGSEGYIGSRFCDEIGKEISTVDIVNGEDVVDPSILQENFSDVDSVVHLAAISGVSKCEEDPVEAIETNIQGTLEVAKFCRDYGKRMIFASSFAVFRHNLYGETKWTGERIIEEICDDYLIFRMSNVYGGDKQTVVNIFIDKWRNDETLPIHSPGTQVRDFIHVSDVVKAYKSAIDSDYVGKIDLVSGQVVSIEELATIISEDVQKVDAGYEDEVFSLSTSAEDLQKINFQPSISLEEGIELEKYGK